VLADVPEEVEQAHVGGPLAVVHQRGAAEALQLRADPGEVAGQRLGVEQVALVGLPARVPDHPRRPAGERDGAVPGLREAPQDEDPDEVADVEAVGGRVAAPVEGGGALRQAGAEGLGVGRVLHEASCEQVGEHVHGPHRGSPPPGAPTRMPPP
jgi:hypothetical protein